MGEYNEKEYKLRNGNSKYSKVVKIWTDDGQLTAHTDNAVELAFAMRFKRENIRAKADPELFGAVEEMLLSLLEAAGKQIPAPVLRVHIKGKRKAGDRFYCPSCGRSAETETGDPYVDYLLDWCNFCGQKIDYENENVIILDENGHVSMQAKTSASGAGK